MLGLDQLQAARGRAVQDAVELAADAAYLLVPLQQLLAPRMEAQQALHLINRALQRVSPSASRVPGRCSLQDFCKPWMQDHHSCFEEPHGFCGAFRRVLTSRCQIGEANVHACRHI